MTQFFALFKMECKNKKPLFPVKNKALNLFLTGIIFLCKNLLILLFLILLSRYILSYAVANSLEYDFLIIAILIVQTIQFFVGINQIMKLEQNSNGIKEELMIPASNQVLYLSKITYIYVRHLLAYIILFVPVLITWGVTTLQGVQFYLMLIPTILLFPTIPILLSSLLAFPTLRVSSFLKTKFYINLIVFSLIIAFGFYYYIQVVKLVIELFENQGIASLLSLEDVVRVQGITSKFYIAVLFKNILTGSVLFKSLTVLLTISFLFFLLVYQLAKKHYRKVMWKMADSEINYSFKNTKIKKRSHWLNLLLKDFKTVFRSYNYSFSFFTIALVTPLIVFFSSKALSEFSFAKTNMAIYPPLTLFLLLIFMTLTTSFSATTITREGKSFIIAKTIPIKAKTQTRIKIVFYTIVQFLAILASVLTLFFAKLISFLDVVLIVISVLGVVYGGICSNINLEIKRPKFKELKNTNSALTNINISKSMSAGISLALFLGVLAIGLSFILKGMIWYVPVLIISLGYALYKHLRLFKNLEKKFQSIEI